METLKKFFKYFLMLIALFAFVTILSNFAVKEKPNEVEYIVDAKNIKIEVTQLEATNSGGKIKGIATNETGELLKDRYLRFDFYNKDGEMVGTNVQDVKYFNVGEKMSFDIDFTYKKVKKIKIGFVDKIIAEEEQGKEIAKKEESPLDIVNPTITENEMKIAIPIAGFLVGSYFLGVLPTL